MIISNPSFPQAAMLIWSLAVLNTVKHMLRTMLALCTWVPLVNECGKPKQIRKCTLLLNAHNSVHITIFLPP